MKTLFVYFESQLVGELHQDEELIYSFTYAESWLKSENRFPLSLSMPLEQRQFGNRVTLSFFENLLPEGEVRQTLEQNHNVQGPFDFLQKFGHDCAGAVILTESEKYIQQVDATKFEKIELQKIYEAISAQESVVDIVAEINGGYLPLAGAQDKFAAVFKDNNFYLPTHGSPTTHIVKAPITRSGVKESVYNELYCMLLAGRIDLNVPSCFVLKGPQPLFIVERYDRYKDASGILHRIHQQDFCQAQGITSDKKYEAKGGPSLKDNYNLIVSAISIQYKSNALDQFINWICYNLFIGNNDSHSKNISILFKNGKYQLAPIYDLLSTALYPKLKQNFSFMIGDGDRFHQIGKNQFNMLEERLDVKQGFFADRLANMYSKLMAEKDKLVSELLKEHPEVKIFNRIADLIEDRAKGLKNQKAF